MMHKRFSLASVGVFLLTLLVINVNSGSSQPLPDLELSVTYALGITIDPVSRALFVSEWSNNRILRFASVDSLASGEQPLAVLGQPDTTTIGSNTGGISAATLNNPRGLLVDAMGTLWVADGSNHRVLWFKDAANLPTGASADGVLGQPGFAANTPSASTMNYPAGLAIQGSILWVCDQANNRILRYDGVTSNAFPSQGAVPAGLIGQSTMADSTLWPANADRFNQPFGLLKIPSGGLYVADLVNARVLYFTEDQAFLTTGAQAAYVYGKSNFTDATTYPVSATTFNYPLGMALGYEGTLFLSDYNNNRVLLFPPVPPTSNQIPAVQVLGQSDLRSSSTGTGLEKIVLPYEMFYDKVTNALWVTDSGNNRVVRYSNILVKPTTNPVQTVEVAFQGNTPQVKIFPKDASGASKPGEQEFYLQPTLLEEVADGVVVASATVPATGWVVNTTTDASGNQYFTFQTSSPVSMTIQYTLFAVASTLNSAGISFSTDPNALKFQVSLSGWNFSSSANSLRVHLRLTILPVVTQLFQFDSADITSFVLNSNNTMTSSINLIRFCVVDSSINSPMSFALNQNSEGANPLDLVLDLPYFSQSVLYDPDFSVTLGGPSLGPGGDGGGGSDSQLLGLLALIALVIPAAFIVLAAGVTAFVCVKRRRQRRAITDMHSSSA